MGVFGRMARLKGLMAALAILSTLTACSTGGGNPLDAITGESKYSPAFIKANIIPGKSTKEQIRQKFGAPTSAQDDVADNTSDWSYYRSDSGFNALKKVLISTRTNMVPERSGRPCGKVNHVLAMPRK